MLIVIQVEKELASWDFQNIMEKQNKQTNKPTNYFKN